MSTIVRKEVLINCDFKQTLCGARKMAEMAGAHALFEGALV